MLAIYVLALRCIHYVLGRGAALRQIPCIYSWIELGALYPWGPHPTEIWPTPILYRSIFFTLYTTGDRHCSAKLILKPHCEAHENQHSTAVPKELLQAYALPLVFSRGSPGAYAMAPMQHIPHGFHPHPLSLKGITTPADFLCSHERLARCRGMAESMSYWQIKGEGLLDSQSTSHTCEDISVRYVRSSSDRQGQTGLLMCDHVSRGCTWCRFMLEMTFYSR